MIIQLVNNKCAWRCQVVSLNLSQKLFSQDHNFTITLFLPWVIDDGLVLNREIFESNFLARPLANLYIQWDITYK